MSNWRRWNLGLGGGLVLAMVLIHVQATAARAGEASPGTEAVGELRIEGGSIERLVLADDKGRIREFDRPGAVLSLPEGKYRLQEVSLAGDYRCWPHMVPEGSLVAVRRDRPGVLKVGAPLSQRIRLQRQGTVLVLHFELMGRAGESYRPPASGGKPHVTIHSHDRQVLSADFAYG